MEALGGFITHHNTKTLSSLHFYANQRKTKTPQNLKTLLKPYPLKIQTLPLPITQKNHKKIEILKGGKC